MTVWEKTLINLQKGHDRLMSFAAAFSERMKAELSILRLRMQLDGVRDKINEQHRFIGQKLTAMKENETLPKSFDLFFQNDEIAFALEKLERSRKDLELLMDDLRRETDALRPAVAGKGKEEKSA